MNLKGLSIQIDEKLLKKLKVTAKRAGRSVALQAQFFIRSAVRDYESKNGTIKTQEAEREMNTYYVTKIDSRGEMFRSRYRVFGYAVAQLLHYIYYPENGDYKITFKRETDRNDAPD